MKKVEELQICWDDSYGRSENFLFYPHEEVIRFFSRRIRRRTGTNSFQDIHPSAGTGRLLDLGCGIGRHVVYALQTQVDAYGIDLSPVAISSAQDWLREAGHDDARTRCVAGDVMDMPWSDGYFTFAVSHGVLDSMPFEVAQAGLRELHRTMQPEGLFYFDVISGDETGRHAEFAEEVVVGKEHEKGTIQSYFNRAKIGDLLGEHFEILECMLIRKDDVMADRFSSRWHVVAERK